MAIGALVNTQTNIVTGVIEAASEQNMQYTFADGVWMAFIPSDTAKVGDHWNGTTFVSTTVPQSISALQARRALNAAGLRSSVEAAVAAADQDTKDAWQFATIVYRNNPIIAAMAAGLGLTTAQVDQLFISGATFAG